MSHIIHFPTAVAQARAWISRRLIERGQPNTIRGSSRTGHNSARAQFLRDFTRIMRSAKRPPHWSHACPGVSGITVGFIGSTCCPYCGQKAPQPGEHA